MRVYIYYLFILSPLISFAQDHQSANSIFKAQPDSIPQIFFPGVISGDNWKHSSPGISPDGNEIYWCSISDKARIWFIKNINETWSEPQISPFSGEFDDFYPKFNGNGNKIYFSSYRPLDPELENTGWGINIWYTERDQDKWKEPEPVGPPVNSGSEFGFSLTDNGDIYFTRGIGTDSFDIYCSRMVNNQYTEPLKLPGEINTEYYEDGPFISPDESYLIFESIRPDGFGGADLYISFRRADGRWTLAENLGPKVNTAFAERFANITRDGKCFFFGSDRNGDKGNIYYMDASFITELKTFNLSGSGQPDRSLNLYRPDTSVRAYQVE
jgi:hypothetical protein